MQMNNIQIQNLISDGENMTVEFKESKNQLNKDVYETVCAFSNRAGGHILLGVKDDGSIVGVDKEAIEYIKKDFVTTINNPQKFSPPLYLNIETIEIENKKILYIEVPQSKSVHSLNGKIFREAVANSLIHREYSSAYVAKMIIENGKVVFENANIPHFYGELQPSNFIPYSKNPTIAKIFREIGFADELGSGIKNLYKYSKAYGGSDPLVVEGEVFRLEVKIPSETTQKTTQKTTKEKVLELLAVDSKMTREDLANQVGVSANAIKQHLANLQAEDKLERIGGRKNGYWKVKNDY